MTYLVGLKRGGQTCIIADTAWTVRTPSGPDEVFEGALKTGQIFPGCVYGLAGDAVAGLRFVETCRRGLPADADMKELWAAFQRFTAVYEDPGGWHFEAIVCERSTGRSRLFSFAPRLGLVEHDDYVTFGAGKRSLDAPLLAFLSDTADELIRRVSDFSPGLVVGAACSLFLTQRSLGDEVTSLKDIGVGGIFHCVFQTNDLDGRQPPSVFLLTRLCPGLGISYMIARVAFVRRAMVVHYVSDGQVKVLCSLDEPSMPELPNMSKDEIDAYLAEVRREALEPPMYQFIGVASLDRETRYANAFSFGGGTDIDWDFRLGQALEKAIQDSYRFRDGIPPMGENWRDLVILPPDANIDD